MSSSSSVVLPAPATSTVMRTASLRGGQVLPEALQALVPAEQGVERGGVCKQHIASSVATRWHPEESVELPVPGLHEWVGSGNVDWLPRQHPDGPRVFGGQRVVGQVHVEVQV